MRIRYWTDRASRFDGVAALGSIAGFSLEARQGEAAAEGSRRPSCAEGEPSLEVTKSAALVKSGKERFRATFLREGQPGRGVFVVELEGQDRSATELARIGAELELLWGLRPGLPPAGGEGIGSEPSDAASIKKREEPSSELGPRSDMAEIGLATIKRTMAGIRRLGRKASFGPEELEALRSRIRRLRAALWLFGPYFFERPGKFARKARAIGQRLSELRDVGASLEAARDHALALDEEGRSRFVPFVEHLAKRKERLERKMAERVEGGALKWLNDLGTRFAKAEEGEPRLDRRVRPRMAMHAAPPLLAKLLMRLLAYGEILESGDDALHRYQEARVRAKRLRMALELMAPGMGEGALAQARTLAALQAELGGIDDALIASSLAQGFSRRLYERGDEEGAAAMERFIDSMRAEARKIAAGLGPSWKVFSEPANVTRLIGAIFPL